MKKAIMSVLTVWILVSSIFVGLMTFGYLENVHAPYIPHDPIRINSDAEFASMAGIEGWIGNGLPGNPYIIEAYDINGSGYGYCIYIGNTTVFFEVRDCYLHEASGVNNPPYFKDSGLMLYNVQNGKLINNTAYSNNYHGIFLSSSYNNNFIKDNIAKLNNEIGIYLLDSNGNIIFHNNASNNDYGIYLFSSNSNTIANNTVSSNVAYGMILGTSNNNIIANNTFSNNLLGIYFSYSSSNTFTNNTMEKNGLEIGGNQIVHWNTHTIDITNTVNGKPVYYWKNQTIGTIPLGAGLVILANCSNVIVENQYITNGNVGIQFGFSSYNAIKNNTIISNIGGGISIVFCSNTTVSNNTVSSNYGNGFWIFSSNNNTIINNSISSNDNFGIRLSSSNNNKVFHNMIMNNRNQQASDNSFDGNQWDNGYPSGGNYWSDYTGNDSYMGPNQDIPGSDGIGDTPYDQIDGGFAKDNYPLMSPIGPYIFLYEGWNLISSPFIQPVNDLDAVLSSINGSFDATQWFNASDSSDPWKHHHISKPSYLNDFTDIDHTIGFWIHIAEPGGVVFEYPGTQPSSNQSIPLHPGWNMVGYPSLTNRNRTAALNNLTFGVEVDAVWAFNAATQTWEEVKAGDYFEVGRGYWVHARQKCVWEVPV